MLLGLFFMQKIKFEVVYKYALYATTPNSYHIYFFICLWLVLDKTCFKKSLYYLQEATQLSNIST